MSESKITPVEQQRAGARRWVLLSVVAIAQLMVVLDATIVNIALPAAQAELGFTDESRQWLVTAYALAFGSLLLTGGRLADLFGQKRAFIAGLIGFAAASVLGGLAGTFELLVAARALQGAFGALLAPAALSVLTTTFVEPAERSRAFGVFGAVAGAGGAAGLLLGGILTEFTSWRWCLYVNVLFAGVALVGALILIPKATLGARPRFDIPGVVTVTLGLIAVVYGFANAETAGWADVVTIVSFAVGVLLLVAFVIIETKVAHPLLPLRVILDRDRGGAMLALALTSVGSFGVFLFLTYYLQLTLGFSALQTGVAFLPMPLSIIVSANFIGGRLLSRVGARIMLFVGGLLGAGGMLLLLRTDIDSNYVTVVLPALVALGLGMGLIYSAGISTGTLGVDPHDAGVASAAVNMMQQVGGSIGTALLSTIYAGALQNYASAHPGDQDLAILHGYHAAFTVSAIVLVAVALVGGLVVNRFRVHASRAVATEDVPVLAH